MAGRRIAPEDYPDTDPVEVFTLDRRRLRWTLGESWAFLEETAYMESILFNNASTVGRSAGPTPI